MAVDAHPPSTSQLAVSAWPSPAELQKLAPLLRLITAIGSVPQVNKITMSSSDKGINLWVFMSEDDYEAESHISRAERTFLNSEQPIPVLVHVIPGTDIAPEMLPSGAVLFER